MKVYGCYVNNVNYGLIRAQEALEPTIFIKWVLQTSLIFLNLAQDFIDPTRCIVKVGGYLFVKNNMV